MKSLALIAFLSACIISINAPAENSYLFSATLTGEQQVEPVCTNTRGSAFITVDPDCGEIAFNLRIKNAEGIFADSGAHIHCGIKGENGPVIAFLAGDMPGGLNGKVTVRGVLTRDNIVSDACGENLEDILEAMLHGKTYVNVHSAANPNGEIRGQLHYTDENECDVAE
ncbi:CHRD domain-containing protein [Endozoicomonas sp.]|uniref:CHRD domain-containing protein n=1 Tax=Endozoicomonas sp. TaxID=1892382 RepID=UPI00288886F0|nr:CHRD domain-containing protein [Endozoicomonas sp.]